MYIVQEAQQSPLLYLHKALHTVLIMVISVIRYFISIKCIKGNRLMIQI